MNTREITVTLTTLFGELVNGPEGNAAYVLNRGDLGLVRSLGKLTARDASATANGGASVAAHVDHLRYGLSLMNRWSAGEHPFDDADWSASWRKTSVSEAEWSQLRNELRSEADRWLAALGVSRDLNAVELDGVMGSIAHLAYHLGAIRQISQLARGPVEPQTISKS